MNSCKNEPKNQTEDSHNTPLTPTKVELKAPLFNEDSAYNYVAEQCKFGPRVPSTAAHSQCEKYLTNELKKYSDRVIINGGFIKTFDGKTHQCKNIIASFNIQAKKRVMLCSHWDSRPFADQDYKNTDQPIDGANDGASGVGILLEIARQLKMKPIDIGIDIIFFDLEDYGQPGDSKYPPMEDSYCLGSQYWSRNLHVKNYKPEYGILLDMVGAPDAQFAQDGGSLKYAREVVNKVWTKAREIGYTNFTLEQNSGVVDDHTYINEIAQIPTIDIIEYVKDKGNPGDHFSYTWHTHNDNIKNISPQTLKSVGQTLMEVIYTEKL